MKAFRITLANSDYPILVIAEGMITAINKLINNKKKAQIIKIEELREYNSNYIIV